MIEATFTRWTIIGVAPSRARCRMALCKCECGTVREVRLLALKRKETKSCGCLSLEIAKKTHVTHGHSCRQTTGVTRTYWCWRSMCSRTSNPRVKGYERYGGRGISVCDRWKYSFSNFLFDMGEKPDGLSIERIDNNGNYELLNCRWATALEQGRNKRNNRLITAFGITAKVFDWSERSGLSAKLILGRLNETGWNSEDAVTRPRGLTRKAQ